MKGENRVLYLLDLYIKGEHSDTELAELFDLISSGEYDHLLDQHILGTLQSDKASIPGSGLDQVRSEAIAHNILTSSKANHSIIRNIFRRKPIRYALGIAAAVAAVLLVSLYFIYRETSPSSEKPVVASLQDNNKQVTNKTDKPMDVRLADGSLVTLQPASSLTYFASAAASKREVILEGDAFFDIAHNAEKPFLVYHGELVTRVLGTSFNIYSNKLRHKAEVEVLRGKVEVYENKKDQAKNHPANGVIITPNQKVTYMEQQRVFSLSLVDKPVPVTANDDKGLSGNAAFHFDQANMADIVQLLHSTYGIEIDMENKKIADCQFSGDISSQDLFAKLDILSQAIGIGYEIKGTRILLTGKGCR